ncbi:hypothetical protein [Crocinitomix catalasitica]|uniref:hypothetical protein n=1 Tax=Crocinitomix catalasitica TaxID=184607 RepID=UPI00047F0C02|nr:hypothetical protein [Crocinitomix catalasitica]
MKQELKNIATVFSIFHDGGIVSCKLDNNLLSITVSCKYLAELISPQFENFYLELNGTNLFEYIPWTNQEEESLIVKALPVISKCEFELIRAKVVDNHVEVNCHEHNSIFLTPGGHFCIKAAGIKIKDENGKTITIDQLKSINKAYWSNF